jgi:hypothetical protein
MPCRITPQGERRLREVVIARRVQAREKKAAQPSGLKFRHLRPFTTKDRRITEKQSEAGAIIDLSQIRR